MPQFEPHSRLHSSASPPALSFDQIDAQYDGQWVLVRITAVDEFQNPLEGKVLARGRQRVNKTLDRIASQPNQMGLAYCTYRAGTSPQTAALSSPGR